MRPLVALQIVPKLGCSAAADRITRDNRSSRLAEHKRSSFFCVDSTSGTFNLPNRCSSTGLVRDPSSQRLRKRVCEYDDTIFSGPLSGSEACPLESRKTAKGEPSPAPNQPGKRHPPFNQHYPRAYALRRFACKSALRGHLATCLSRFQVPQWRGDIR